MSLRDVDTPAWLVGRHSDHLEGRASGAGRVGAGDRQPLAVRADARRDRPDVIGNAVRTRDRSIRCPRSVQRRLRGGARGGGGLGGRHREELGQAGVLVDGSERCGRQLVSVGDRCAASSALDAWRAAITTPATAMSANAVVTATSTRRRRLAAACRRARSSTSRRSASARSTAASRNSDSATVRAAPLRCCHSTARPRRTPRQQLGAQGGPSHPRCRRPATRQGAGALPVGVVVEPGRAAVARPGRGPRGPARRHRSHLVTRRAPSSCSFICPPARGQDASPPLAVASACAPAPRLGSEVTSRSMRVADDRSAGRRRGSSS